MFAVSIPERNVSNRQIWTLAVIGVQEIGATANCEECSKIGLGDPPLAPQPVCNKLAAVDPSPDGTDRNVAALCDFLNRK